MNDVQNLQQESSTAIRRSAQEISRTIEKCPWPYKCYARCTRCQLGACNDKVKTPFDASQGERTKTCPIMQAQRTSRIWKSDSGELTAKWQKREDRLNVIG